MKQNKVKKSKTSGKLNLMEHTVDGNKAAYVAIPTKPLSTGYSMQNGSNNTVVIKGIDQIQTVTVLSTGNYQATISDINIITMDGFNMWVGKIGKGWQRWRPIMVRAHYKPCCSTGTNGRVGLQFRPDTVDSPSSMAQLMTYSNTTVAAVRDEAYVMADCKSLNQPWYYVADAGGTVVSPRSASTPFAFIWATDASNEAKTCGHVYLEYHLEFRDRVSPTLNT